MKRSLKKIMEYKVLTIDKTEGDIKDFLFDEKRWIIRYMKADFGNFFSPEKVLVPKEFLAAPDWENRFFPIKMSNDEIDKCPKLDDHQPMSRKYEEMLFEHYDLKPYWYSAYTIPIASSFYPPRPLKVPSVEIDEDKLDTILRSFEEVKGYHIQAIDGKIGHIEDIIVDDDDWQIVYVVIDTSNWLPWSKKVLIAIDWMETISYEKREVKINLHTDSIANAPEYDESQTIDESFEKTLYDFYSASLIK
jgi:sporulation protein YlmC with PRC-barrel domain